MESGDDSKDINVDNSTFSESKGSDTFVIDIPLSSKLRERNTVENITLDTRPGACNVKVVLNNNGIKRTIISTIHSKWSKSIKEFEAQADRKNVSRDEIIDITDCLDENYERIIGRLDDAKTASANAVHNNDDNKSKQQTGDSEGYRTN